MAKRHGVAAWLFMLAVAPACAAGLFGGDAPDPDETPWAEAEFELPAFPQAENLLPFTVGAVRDTRYFVDGNSITLGADGVLRYTLVIISASGAENISHEGMRCDTGERRTYAFGRRDKTWSKARSDKWQPVRAASNTRHTELFVNYLCKIGAPPGVEEIKRLLRYAGNRLEMPR